MLGTFQSSDLRIEVEASELLIRDALLRPAYLRQWLWFQKFPETISDPLKVGEVFTTWLGPVSIQHQVVEVGRNSLKMSLSKGIDGYHHWCWGDGWVQSSLEGISLLPLNLGQTLSLMQLRSFLHQQRSR